MNHSKRNKYFFASLDVFKTEPKINNKFLKLKDNYIPQLGIHKEYFDFFLEPKYCCSIIKSGKNKGKKCVNKVTKSGSCTIIDGVKKYYCGRHKIKKNINLLKLK